MAGMRRNFAAISNQFEHGPFSPLCFWPSENMANRVRCGQIMRRVLLAACFAPPYFLLGIRHERSDPGCPWQNGRIERLFGTLKAKLDWLEVVSFDALNVALGEFRFWYNQARPHRHLGGATPAEAWSGVNPFAAKIKSEYWFEAWDGLLQGYYLRR